MPLKIKLIFISIALFLIGSSLFILQEKRDSKSDFSLFPSHLSQENSISLIVG